MTRALLLSVAGLLAGAMNAAAGGGSFVTVPVLIWLGVPSVSANMSSTIALYPGSLTSAWAYRRHIQPLREVSVTALILTTSIGGVGGAMLLFWTPSSYFDKILPWLLLVGSAAFACAGWIGRKLQSVYQPDAATLLTAQFFFGIYGGYFGGAMGIMMMSLWSILGIQDIKAMSAIKVIMVASANTVAVLCFSLAGRVVWHDTLIILLAASAGGYLGARMSLLIRSTHLRAGIVVINFATTGAFFYFKFFK